MPDNRLKSRVYINKEASNNYKEFRAIMDNKVETTREKVLEAAKESAAAKKLLMGLYPEVFENNKVLCNIGCIFFRNKYPKNIYAVVRQNHRIVIMNITFSTLWTEKKAVLVSELKDPAKETITVSEFVKLTGYTDLTEFTILAKNCNEQLHRIILHNRVRH